MQNLVYGAAKRWIAGKDMKTALGLAKQANSRGLGTILNFLGEDITDGKVAKLHFDEYVRLQREIESEGIDGCVSVKLTQIGLETDHLIALERSATLAREASSVGKMLWIDMEGSAFTTKTLEVYSRLLESYKNVGVAVQAYLRRSEDDIKKLVSVGGKVRLVKGAYREPAGVVFNSREDVTANYIKLLHLLFDKCEYFAVGTHDSRPIGEAKKLHAANPSVKFEFEMLRGIRDELKLELAREGHRVVDYMPYGEEWYPYSVRRIKEHPSNIWLLLRSL